MSGERKDSDQLLAELDALLGPGVSVPRASTPAVERGPLEESAEAPRLAGGDGESGVRLDGDGLGGGSGSHERCRVLIIDDSKDYRDAVYYILQKKGIEVSTAGNGKEGLEKLMKEKPCLVLVDFNMPEKNGYEVIQEVRSNDETRKIPIVMFTGAPNRRHLKEMGMDIEGFLEKPVSNAKLVEVVMQILRDGRHGGTDSVSGTASVPELPPEPPEAPAPPPAREEIVTPPVELLVPKPAPANGGAAPAAPEEDVEEGVPDLRELEERDSEEAEELLIDIEKEEKEEEAHGLEVMANDSPLVNRVNKILVRAVDQGASDIHIEPQEKKITVRLRINGTLSELCSLPLSLGARLAARIKIMSDLVITERRLPQDGQFRAAISGRKVEFRVSTLPSAYGEKIVLRILGVGKVRGDVSELALSERDLASVQRVLQTPHGLILVTGPTGSGKTTTLYSMIASVNKPDVNVLTAEDPIEYRLPGITQVHVKSGIGLTFEAALRSFLRQDPDIMLIGEIRDLETAEIAVKASITGHLVLSTLHTNSAPATVVRLAHMGVAPYLIASSVKLIVAQRLIRTLCPQCRSQEPAKEHELRLLGDEERERVKGAWRAVGCRRCHETGYAGRRPVFEVMPVLSPEMRQAVLSGGGMDAVARIAVREGMTSLRDAALEAVERGDTSLSEALKIILAE